MNGRTKTFGKSCQGMKTWQASQAYKWVQYHLRHGHAVLYKPLQSCKSLKVSKVVLEGENLYAATDDTLVSINGCDLVAKDGTRTLDVFTWRKKFFTIYSHVSWECMEQKESFIKERLGKGTLTCYPQGTAAPVIIYYYFKDKGGIYTYDPIMNRKVYLQGLFIYFISHSGEVECIRNW